MRYLRKINAKVPGGIFLWLAILWTAGTLFVTPWSHVFHQLEGQGLVFLILLILSEMLFVSGLAMIAVGLRKEAASWVAVFVAGLVMLLSGLLLAVLYRAVWWSLLLLVVGGLVTLFGPGGSPHKKFAKLWGLRSQFETLLARGRESRLCRVGFWVNAAGALVTACVLVLGLLIVLPWRNTWPWALLCAWDIVATVKLRKAVLASSRPRGCGMAGE